MIAPSKPLDLTHEVDHDEVSTRRQWSDRPLTLRLWPYHLFTVWLLVAPAVAWMWFL